MSQCDKLQQKALSLDLYHQQFSFLLPDHSDNYRSFLGTTLTIFTVISLTLYATFKLTVLASLKEYNLETAIHENFLDIMESFGPDDEFNVAAAITNYDNSSEVVEDPDYGLVKFYSKSFGFDKFVGGVQLEELKSELCEANASNERAVFYPASPNSAKDQELYAPKLKCITEPYDILGQYDNQLGRNLVVVLERCDSSQRASCHSSEETKAWMKGKYLIIVVNETKFIQHKFYEEKISKRSKLTYHALDPNNRVDTSIVVHRTEAELTDAVLTIDTLGTQVISGFHPVQGASRPLVYDNNFHTSLTYELSQDQTKYVRSIYGFFDLASDLGGLASFLAPFFFSVVATFQKDGAHTFLMAEMFKTQEADAGQQMDGVRPKHADDFGIFRRIQWNCCRLTQSSLQRLCPTRFQCFCLKPNRKARLFSERYDALEKELHASYLLKHIRIFKALFKEKMTKQEWSNASQTYSTKSYAKKKPTVQQQEVAPSRTHVKRVVHEISQRQSRRYRLNPFEISNLRKDSFNTATEGSGHQLTLATKENNLDFSDSSALNIGLASRIEAFSTNNSVTLVKKWAQQ